LENEETSLFDFDDCIFGFEAGLDEVPCEIAFEDLTIDDFEFALESPFVFDGEGGISVVAAIVNES
jgi:hypothetical protein